MEFNTIARYVASVTVCFFLIGCQQPKSTAPANGIAGGADYHSGLANVEYSFGNLKPDAAKRMRDELTFQRATQLYLWALPTLNMYAIKEGAEVRFGEGYNVLSIFKERLNAKALIPTPNSDVIYAFAFLDLKDGPMVIEAPPGLQGLIDDYRQRPIKSVGEIDGKQWSGDVSLGGPDRGKGGKYLLIPPDFKGPIPHDEKYFVFQPKTYGVFVFWRGFYNDPKQLEEPVKVMEQTKIYPVSKKATAKPMVFPDASNVPVNMLYPHDFSAFQMLDRFIQHEYADPADFEFRGMAQALGIQKGKPFQPDETMKNLLDQAAKTAWAMGHMINQSTPRYYGNRKYLSGMPPTGPEFNYDTYTDLDRRTAFFTLAYGTSPLMFLDMPNMGSKYPYAFADADGDPFDGNKNYKLHLPANIPAKILWSITLYDPLTGVGLDNGQPFPSINQMDKPPTNPDGSYDFYFGPQSPGEGKNYIATVRNKPFFVSIRLYAPTQSFFDQTWKPDDVVKVK